MTVKIINQLKDTSFRKLANGNSPFLAFEFFEALAASGSIGNESGWEPIYFEEKEKSLLYTFIKSHSYGEYIFDWDWANFYQKHKIPYYPKLTSMIPVTPVTSPHFLGELSTNVMKKYEEFYQENSFSSSHFLFVQEHEIPFFESFGYMKRESFQYHFFNEYNSFEDFLGKLKNKKAKQIVKERSFDKSIEFHQYSGETLTAEHGLQMYQFYLSTIDNKHAIPYLKENFFQTIFEKLKERICYIQATKEGRAIAGALYFYNEQRLYGRYYGATSEIPNLHFELCYYQGIDFCIKKKIPVFEAGAQGEHKIARGFRPTKTYSVHKLKHPAFHQAIHEYIKSEKKYIDDLLPTLSERLPFIRSENVL